jgi:K+ transporter
LTVDRAVDDVPMVALATMATVIASQAVITGAFSLTRQAQRLCALMIGILQARQFLRNNIC